MTGLERTNDSTFADCKTMILIQASAGAEIACLASDRITI